MPPCRKDQSAAAMQVLFRFAALDSHRVSIAALNYARLHFRFRLTGHKALPCPAYISANARAINNVKSSSSNCQPKDATGDDVMAHSYVPCGTSGLNTPHAAMGGLISSSCRTGILRWRTTLGSFLHLTLRQSSSGAKDKVIRRKRFRYVAGDIFGRGGLQARMGKPNPSPANVPINASNRIGG